MDKTRDINVLSLFHIATPLGPMVAIADDQALYVLEFADSGGVERAVARLKKLAWTIVPGRNPPIQSIEFELEEYFRGALSTFKTPFILRGTPFQRRVWEELKTIPSGATRSYAEVAAAIGQPRAFRAVANANGANHLALVVPCHRVIRTQGELGGYGGGLHRKKWLLHHETGGLA